MDVKVMLFFIVGYIGVIVVVGTICHARGYDKGWQKGHEDTRKATLDTLRRCKGYMKWN